MDITRLEISVLVMAVAGVLASLVAFFSVACRGETSVTPIIVDEKGNHISSHVLETREVCVENILDEVDTTEVSEESYIKTAVAAEMNCMGDESP